NEQHIFVMQYANDGNLKSYLIYNKHKSSLDDKISFNKAILKGLEFLHNNDILHRDLHSKNVLVHNGKTLLGDFGLSKYLFEENDGHISEVRGREKPENGTPLDYKKIYEDCWCATPSLRPEISEILDRLNILKPSPTYQGDNVSMT
ncbi:17438_t:CDS:2, partial [Cetraspora pellucida]